MVRSFGRAFRNTAANSNDPSICCLMETLRSHLKTREVVAMDHQASELETARQEWLSTVATMRAESWSFDQSLDAWQQVMRGIPQPWPMWFPSSEITESSNVMRFAHRVGCGTFAALYDWSIKNRAEFWRAVVLELGITFDQPPTGNADFSAGVAEPDWLPGSLLNIARSCFREDGQHPAVIIGDAHGGMRRVSSSELRQDAERVAAALKSHGMVHGDAIGIMMPMNYESVAIYLGVLLAGCAVVSIADSFAAPQIQKRLEISRASAIFCVAGFQRAGKTLELWSRILDANPPPAIVLPGPNGAASLRDNDITWDSFLAKGTPHSSTAAMAADATINILFSSGTTGDPKAIPWNQTTPIKCAADGFFHHDIRPGDVVAWPTNLGWMMGPWLVFATLINRGTIAIYDDVAVGEPFGRFVHQAGVTMLGVVPTLVRSWRRSQCMESSDWSTIRCFSSTGEASFAEDMFYLSWLAGSKPVIEYCGGTEIGGGYVSSTVVQPNIPAAFSTPALGSQLVILDDQGCPASTGDLFLVPPTMGLSDRLLNRDHHETYFADVPHGPDGEVLRRHGDHFSRIQTPLGEYFVAGGRVDDTMNLGGIKVSSAEIEKVLNDLEGIDETAAIAVADQGSGPDKLVVFAVASTNTDCEDWMDRMNRQIRGKLNPLFRVSEVVLRKELPRTASNKVMRRKLREEYNAGTDKLSS